MLDLRSRGAGGMGLDLWDGEKFGAHLSGSLHRRKLKLTFAECSGHGCVHTSVIKSLSCLELLV